MFKRLDFLFWLLALIVVSRFLSMAIMPMVGTSEARYSEIARIMAETGDWITPWFNYGVPFWGKPPLSFWLEALSFNLFGVTEFTARLPSWIANLGVLALIYYLTLSLTDKRQALIATLIFSSMALSYVMSGAVLTDPFLALGTTLSFVSIILALRQADSLWRWWFFVGIVIGLMAKGPLVLVLIGGPLILWIVWRRQWCDLKKILWGRGALLTILLSLPWYIMAELKTPGFINYFIVGEHFLRFIDPDWAGNLYGKSHDQTFGTIWLYWVWATFPWGPIAVVMFSWRWVFRRADGISLTDEQRLLLILALFPSLFFSFSGNILWTYQLPALAPLAILIAMMVANPVAARKFPKIGGVIVAASVPLLVMTLAFYAHYYPENVKTEKALIAYYDEQRDIYTPPLIYLGKPPFSARFYSKGGVTSMTLSEVKSLMNSKVRLSYYLAIPNEIVDNVISSLSGRVYIKLVGKRFTLLKIS